MVQNSDGGWGESCGSYDDPSTRGVGPSTPSQTAWALIGLLAAGDTRSDSVAKGVCGGWWIGRRLREPGVSWLPDGMENRFIRGPGFRGSFIWGTTCIGITSRCWR